MIPEAIEHDYAFYPWRDPAHGWRRQVELLLRQALPIDLGDETPIHVLDLAEFAPCFDTTDALGLCGPLVASAMADYLPGIDDGDLVMGIAHERVTRGRQSHVGRTLALAAVALHEATHFVERSETAHLAGCIAREVTGGREYVADMVAAALERPDASARDLWTGHDAGFIRCALHVVHRARALAGFPLFADSCYVAGAAYGLSPAGEYESALGAELTDQIDAPIRTVLTTPTPGAFTELFIGDTTEEPESCS